MLAKLTDDLNLIRFLALCQKGVNYFGFGIGTFLNVPVAETIVKY